MPQVKEYTSQVDRLRPDERGTDARLQEARRTGAFYNQAADALTGAAKAQADAAGDVAHSAAGVADAFATLGKQQEDYAGHREIAKGAAAGAQLFSNLNDQWDAAVKAAGAKDPNDPTVAAKFRETVMEPALQNFKDAYSGTDLGQKWSEQHVEQMRNHLFTKTSADMSTLAAQAVRVNVDQLSNATSNTAFKSPDPHTVDYLLGQVDASVNAIIDSSPNLKGAMAAKARSELTEAMKEKIVKAGAAGAIAKAADPEAAAKTFADRYPQYMNGPESASLAKAAKTQAKTNTLQEKQIEVYQRQKNEHAAQQAATKVFAENVTIDPVTSRPIVNPKYFNQAIDVARMPDAPPTLARTLLDWGEHQQNARAQATISDPIVKQTLVDGLFSVDKPTTEIDLMRANIAGKLSNHDFYAIHQLQKTLEEAPLKNPIVHETLHGVKELLGTDPVGAGKYASFVQDFVPQYLAAKKQGTLPPNALDIKDPKSMISQAMAPYQRPTTQIMQDRILRGSGLNFGAPSINLTGEGKTVTGQQVLNAEPIPDAKRREIGKTYQTPSGARVWRGTGWEAAK